MVTPAISSCLSCNGTIPSRNVSTSAAVISRAAFGDDSVVGFSDASFFVSTGLLGTWPITNDAKIIATIGNAIDFLTIGLLNYMKAFSCQSLCIYTQYFLRLARPEGKI